MSLSESESMDECPSATSDGLPQYTDVVIIGGGPAGLSLALELKKFGADCVILDHSRIEYPREAPVDVELPTQATLLVPETLDILQELGLINEVTLCGRQVDGAMVLLEGEIHTCRSKFDSSPLTKFRSCLSIEQWRLEHFMADKLKRMGVQIFRQYVVFRMIIKVAPANMSPPRLNWSETALRDPNFSSAASDTSSQRIPPVGKSISPEYYRVKVFVKRMDPLARRPALDHAGHWIRAKYVVGADGVRSMTRRALKIDMTVLSPVQEYLVADVCVSKWGTSNLRNADSVSNLPLAVGNDASEKICIIHSEMGSGMLIPYRKPDFWRLMVQRTPLQDQSVENSNIAFRKLEPPTDAEISDILVQLIPNTVLESVAWRMAYCADRRIATSFVKESGIIIGDAARFDGPFWSSGINSAIQDSISLGWRLALVLQNKLPHSFLDTFNQERLVQSRLVMQQNIRVTNRLLSYQSIVPKLTTFMSKQQPQIMQALQDIAHLTLDLSIQLRSTVDTGDIIGPCRVLGFTANEDVPPRMLHLRQLTRDGNHALLLLVKVVSPKLRSGVAAREMFCCERNDDSARKQNYYYTETSARYNEQTVCELTKLASLVVSVMGSDVVRPVWVVCGISTTADQDQKHFQAVGQLTKQVPFAFKNYLLQSADLRAASYSVMDVDCEVQNRSNLHIVRQTNWLLSSVLPCAEIQGVKAPDAKSSAFLLMRPDGRVAAKGFLSDPQDMSQLKSYLSRFNQKL